MTLPTISRVDAVIAVAIACLPVREAGENRGRFVDSIIEFAGERPTEPWCASFVYYCGRLVCGSGWPLPKTRSCDVLLEFARSHGLLVTLPQRGDLFLVLKTDTDAVHVGFVESLRPDQGPNAFGSLEGNTNTDGSSNGIGVFRNVRGKAPRTRYAFVRWEAQG